jgi:DNA repair exonuclease SbcCD ATPase subunit
LQDCVDSLSAAREAQAALQLIAAEIQSSAHLQIAGVVSAALRTVFGEDAYDLEIEFRKSRGKTEARYWFARGGNRVSTRAVGGGVIDVASFALRLASLYLRRPKVRKLIVADEPFRHLSRDHSERVKSLILELSEKLNFQLLFTTHDVNLACGTVVEIGG